MDPELYAASVSDISNFIKNLEPGEKIKKKKSNGIGLAWNLSIYNILGRNNPFSVFFVAEDGEIKGRQSAIFNVPIPSLNLSVKF